MVADLAGAEIGFDVAGGIGPGKGLAEARRQALIERLAAGKEVVELGLARKGAQRSDEARKVFLVAEGAVEVGGMGWVGSNAGRSDR